MLVKIRGKKEQKGHCWWECKSVPSLQKAVWKFIEITKNRPTL